MSVPQSKSKNFILNLNVYRNAHFRTLSAVKIAYADAMEPQILLLPWFDRIRLIYTLFPKTRRLTDVSNVCSIHDKFFCDALVKGGKMTDDNYLYLPGVMYLMGEVDKDNPRVEIEIDPITE